MDPRMTAMRAAKAQARINKSASMLAERHGLQGEVQALASASHREPALSAMLKQEAVADLLEALADTEPAASSIDDFLTEAENAQGVGPKTIEALRAHFAQES